MIYIKQKYRLGIWMIWLATLLPLQLLHAAPLLPPLNNTNSGVQLPGKFIWFDLATAEIASQKQFYARVFGWTFQQVEQSGAQYTLIKNAGINIAGMFQVTPPAGARRGALWISLMSVVDPNKAARQTEQAGGSIHTPVTSLAQRGTYALLRDPEGALFGVLKSDSGDPQDHAIRNGEFLWVDHFARDMQRAAAFYQQLVGYDVIADEKYKQRKFLRVANKYRAGIVPLPEKANRSGWLPYIKVDDVAATLKKVEAAGGQIMVEPDKSLLDGNLAIFADPEGGVIGIVKWEQP